MKVRCRAVKCFGIWGYELTRRTGKAPRGKAGRGLGRVEIGENSRPRRHSGKIRRLRTERTVLTNANRCRKGDGAEGAGDAFGRGSAASSGAAVRYATASRRAISRASTRSRRPMVQNLEPVVRNLAPMLKKVAAVLQNVEPMVQNLEPRQAPRRRRGTGISRPRGVPVPPGNPNGR